MSRRFQFVLITVFGTLLALGGGVFLWPPSSDIPLPPASLLPFFAIVRIVESVGFGLGVAFLILGWPLLKKSDKLTKLAFLSGIWSLTNWWAHDALHMHVGTKLPEFLLIEYGFHVTLVITGVVLVYFFFSRIFKVKLS